jgi:prophage tail gpP-like protein
MSSTADFMVDPYMVSGAVPDYRAASKSLDPFGENLPSMPGKDVDAFTIIVNDMEIPVMSGKAQRCADTAASGWTAVVAFTEDDDALAEALTPYKYPAAACYLGEKLVCKGRLYTVAPELTDDGRVCTLEGWSHTVDIVDSTSDAPYEAKNITLEQRARALVEPFGIKVIFDADDRPFKRVTIRPTEKIFDHLAHLAAQRGVLISSTEQGELKFMKAKDVFAALGQSVGTIEEALPPGMEFKARFDGRQRYNVYKALALSPGRKHKIKKNSKAETAEDAMVTLYATATKGRQLTFEVNELEGGEMADAAEWRRSKQMAEALTVSFPVSSWYAPNGALWKENTLVTVISKTMYVPDGFDFLIRSVEYDYDEKGTTAVLGLCPPQVFTGEPIDEPWATATARKTNLIDRLVGSL